MGLYPIEPTYSVSTWYDYQGMADLWTGTDLQLDLTRHIINSDAYFFQGIAFPKGSTDVLVPPGSTFTGTINLVPYSYVISVTAFVANGNQFTIRIYDKGALTDVYAKQFAWSPTVVSNMTGSFNEGQVIFQGDQNKPFGPYFFRSPLIVLPPGVLQISLTNVGIAPILQNIQFIQLFFNIAVPKNTSSMQNQAIETNQDPTGTQSLGAAGAAVNIFGGG